MGRRARFADQKRVLTGTAEPLEARRLFAVVAGTEVAFQAGAGTTLADGDGTAVTFALSGPGSGTVARHDDGRLHLTLRDTTAASAVTISTDAAGDGLAVLGDVEVAGALRSLTARTADLHGDLAAAGPVRTLWLNAAGNGGNTITAPTLGELRTNGDLAADVRVAGQVGAIHVGGSASGLLVRAPRIDRFDVRGDLTGAKVLLFPGPDHEGRAGLRRLTVGGVMRASRVNALADIGAVSAGAMFDSDVVAGVRFEEPSPAAGAFEPVLPRKRGEYEEVDFTGYYSVGAVSVNGRAGVGGFAFVNSRVAAHTVGSVRLAGVQPENGGREFGVAAYYLKRAQRRFGGPGGAALTRQEYPRTNQFTVRQIYEKPLVFNPSTGTYGSGVRHVGYSLDYVGYTGGWYGARTFDIPSGGMQVGTVASHPAAATVVLNPDGSYDARDAQGAVVAQHATLAGLAAALTGTPGTSVKIVDVAVTGSPSTAAYAAGSLTFLSTSVGPEVTIAIQGEAVFRSTAGTEYSLPTGEEARAATEALGIAAEVFTQPLMKVTEAPVLIGRRFDDDRGARSVVLSPTLGLVVQTAGQEDEDGGTDVAAALIGEAARLGRERRSLIVHTGPTGLTLSGLGDGGTAVFYFAGKGGALNATGDTIAFPTSGSLQKSLTDFGVYSWAPQF